MSIPSGGDASPQSKWEVFTDEHGSMYFCNALTGESVWELPPEEDDDAVTDLSAGSRAENASAELCALAFDPAASSNTTQSRRRKDDFSDFEIAIGVIDAMLAMLDKLEDGVDSIANDKGQTKAHKAKKFMSPAAEARFKKNQVNDEKKKKRLREKQLAIYLQIAISPTARNNINDDHKDTREPHEQSSPQTAGLNNVGTLFTIEDTIGWRLEREVEQIKLRRMIRKEKQKHQKQVLSLKKQQEMLKSFRTELTTYFLSQIECSTELQQQRILLLSSPQQIAEMELKRKQSMEPELAERYAKEQQTARTNNLKNIQKVFVLIDTAAQGKLHLLQILFGIFTLERSQQYALKVRGLAELINSQEIQKFVVDFVSSAHDRDSTVTIDEFVEFVAIIEDVMNHFTSVKAAVKEAEDEIEATLEAAASKPGTSLVRARLGIVSKKKIKQEIAALKATEEQIRLRQMQEQQEAFRSDEGFALAPKEVWEKNHHHRFIQFAESLPLYCCLCRRRKWEIERREYEEHESVHRSSWTSRYAVKLKEEELNLVEKDDLPQPSEESTAVVPRGDERTVDTVGTPIIEVEDHAATSKLSSYLLGDSEEDAIVFQVVRSLVTLTERLMSQDPDSERRPPTKRRVHKKGDHTTPKLPKHKKVKDKKSKSNTSSSEADAKLQLAMEIFESEENERKAMHVEEVQMMLYLERNRRALERPLLQVQDAAYNSYIRMLSHIVNPTSFLYRLQFLRCLQFTPPQQLVLQMLDRSENTLSDGSSTNYFILQTVPCRDENEGNHMIKQLKILEEKLQSPFVVKVVSVSKHTFQFFADSGMLVECWPVLFVATEYFPAMSWLKHFRTRYLENEPENPGRAYAEVEQHLFAVFRQVTAGLAALHSLGVFHLNINLDNVFVSHLDSTGRPHVKIAGFLACKVAFTDEQLKSGAMQQCINYSIAPPETLKEGKPVTAKADVWMLGCALYGALMLWQKQQLQAYVTSNRSGEKLTKVEEKVVVHLKTIQDILQEIPISTSTAMRSLLRMLLQPNPAQRPQMSQVIDFLSFAGKQNLMSHG